MNMNLVLINNECDSQSTTNQSNTTPKPIQQYGMSEAVLSCSWFPQNPTQLVAGMAYKWLRIYDTRGK
jgi:hypothetical protein